MKKIILSFFAAGLSFITYAQNVGIGTKTPTAALDVSGTLRFRNNGEGTGKVLTSDGLGNAAWNKLTRSEIYSVSSAAFQPEVSADFLIRSSGQGGVFFLAAPASATFLVAPVNLPQGASVTELTFYFMDNSAEDLTLIFQEEFLNLGFFDVAASATTSGASADWRSLTITPATPIIIDNTDGSYSVKAYGTWPGSSDLAVKGVRIKYTYAVNN